MSRSLRTKASRAVGAFGTPLLYAAAAVVLGLALPRIEARLLPDLVGAAYGRCCSA